MPIALPDRSVGGATCELELLSASADALEDVAHQLPDAEAADAIRERARAAFADRAARITPPEAPPEAPPPPEAAPVEAAAS